MLDTTRHVEILNPQKWDIPLHLIGCGAVGSKVALSIAKLGIKGEYINVYDFDKVEEHNLANQLFGLQDIANYKAESVRRIIKETTGTEIKIFPVKVEAQNIHLIKQGIVMLIVDTMSSRREIAKLLKFSMNNPMIIDTRMGADIMEVLTTNPMSKEQMDSYISTFCDDDIADVSYCGSPISVGSTSGILADLAVWNLIKYANQIYPSSHAEAKERDNTIHAKIMLCMRPLMLQATGEYK